MHVYCDFDGTISDTDTVDEVLRQLTGAGWLPLQQDWIDGKISSAECMRRQIAIMPRDDLLLEAVLDTIGIREGFRELIHWCQEEQIPFTIVSDGVDRFINHILAREELGFIPIVSNRLVAEQDAHSLLQPFIQEGCKAGTGVCKCNVIASRPFVFIGDGRSDFCISPTADLLFARDQLAAHSEANGIAYTPFDTFFDIIRELKTHLGGRQLGRTHGKDILLPP